MHVYEDTGLIESVELNNLCDSYQRGSFEHTIKYFVLRKLAYTMLCPVKKVSNKNIQNKIGKYSQK